MNLNEFVRDILSFNGMKEAFDYVHLNYGDAVPVVLASEFGFQLSNNIYIYNNDEIEKIFYLIEAAMNSGNKRLEECVATGLLEALYNRSYEDIEKWKFIESQLGVSSKKYIDDWLSFTG